MNNKQEQQDFLDTLVDTIEVMANNQAMLATLLSQTIVKIENLESKIEK